MADRLYGNAKESIGSNANVWMHRFKVEMSPVNLDRIQSWIDQGRIDPNVPITMKELAKSRCLHGVKRHGVKLLARVSLTVSIIISPSNCIPHYAWPMFNRAYCAY
jgi:hypothetical protein